MLLATPLLSSSPADAEVAPASFFGMPAGCQDLLDKLQAGEVTTSQFVQSCFDPSRLSVTSVNLSTATCGVYSYTPGGYVNINGQNAVSYGSLIACDTVMLSLGLNDQLMFENTRAVDPYSRWISYTNSSADCQQCSLELDFGTTLCTTINAYEQVMPNGRLATETEWVAYTNGYIAGFATGTLSSPTAYSWQVCP